MTNQTATIPAMANAPDNANRAAEDPGELTTDAAGSVTRMAAWTAAGVADAATTAATAAGVLVDSVVSGADDTEVGCGISDARTLPDGGFVVNDAVGL